MKIEGFSGVLQLEKKLIVIIDNLRMPLEDIFEQ